MKNQRPYQSQAISTSLSKLTEGVSRQIITLPTGAGKTFTVVKLVEQGQFNSTLFCCDTEELCEQAGMAFISDKFDKRFYDYVKEMGFINYVRNKPVFAGSGYKIGLIKADVFEPTGSLVIASLATLHRRLDRINPSQYDCIVIDECHIAAAPSIVKSIDYFKPKLLLGVTATPMRADGLKLENVFNEIVYEYPLHQAIKEGYLVELDAIKIRTNVSLDAVKTKGGDFNEGQLSQEIDTHARNNLIADSYLKYCNGQKAIGFAVTIEHAMHLAEAFIEKGISATAVSSNEELTGDRSAKIKAFKAGTIKVIFNVGILTKGFDDPEVSCIIMARPTKSYTLFMQCIGRATRTLTGTIDGLESVEERLLAIQGSEKKKAVILDIVDNTTKHNLINSHELDKELPLEDRVFLTREKKDKIAADREAKKSKITHEQKEDEIIKLFAVPKVKAVKRYENSRPATEKQLAVIARWGYDIVNASYNMNQINEIFASQEISEAQKWFFKKKGYDVDGKSISVIQAKLIGQEIKEREEQQMRYEKVKLKYNIK